MSGMPDLSTLAWRTSSHSSGRGGDCVQIAVVPAAWRKSSHSGGRGGECVEVADLGADVAVRDSKNPDGPKLLVSRSAWHGLVGRHGQEG